MEGGVEIEVERSREVERGRERGRERSREVEVGREIHTPVEITTGRSIEKRGHLLTCAVRPVCMAGWKRAAHAGESDYRGCSLPCAGALHAAVQVQQRHLPAPLECH